MRPKYDKKLTFLNEKKKTSRTDDLSKYRKIYKEYRMYEEKTSAKTSINRITIQKEMEKLSKLKSLFGTYKNQSIKQKQQKKWENLTKPQLPFSKRTIIPKEEKLKKVESLKPSNLYHDNHMINWIRGKYSSSVIEKSLYTILPEKDRSKKPEKESELRKRRRKMLEYLESLREPLGKEKYVKINPKYFYNDATFKKIQKLKDIFIEFDQNGNRKMSIDEITNLFNQNNIKANEDELVRLFFQNKKIKKKDYFRLNLDFYNFLKFALNKGQDFRLFMRKLKAKLEEEDKKNEDKKDKNIYLPMNLNLLLDYFILKSKEKSSTEKIENAIEKIDNVIKKIENRDKDIYSSDHSFQQVKIDNVKTPKKGKSIKEDSYLSSSDQINKDYSFDNLDFKQLIDEFGQLFTLNKSENFENTSEIKLEKKEGYNTIEHKINFKDNKIDTSKFSKIKKKFLPSNNLYKKSLPIFYKISKNSKDIMGNAIKQKMNQTAILNMNFDNYKKFHNIKLALEATKEKVENMKLSNNMNPNINYRLNKFFNKSSSLKSYPLVAKRYKNPINEQNQKKSFIFKYKNMSHNTSLKLFTKKELINFNKPNIYNESKNSISNNRRTNKSSLKFNENKSCNLLDKRKEKFDYYSERKLDYVPVDLFSGN